MNDSCSVHHKCNIRNYSDISIAYAQYHRIESGVGAVNSLFLVNVCELKMDSVHLRLTVV